MIHSFEVIIQWNNWTETEILFLELRIVRPHTADCQKAARQIQGVMSSGHKCINEIIVKSRSN